MLKNLMSKARTFAILYATVIAICSLSILYFQENLKKIDSVSYLLSRTEYIVHLTSTMSKEVDHSGPLMDTTVMTLAKLGNDLLIIAKTTPAIDTRTMEKINADIGMLIAQLSTNPQANTNDDQAKTQNIHRKSIELVTEISTARFALETSQAHNQYLTSACIVVLFLFLLLMIITPELLDYYLIIKNAANAAKLQATLDHLTGLNNRRSYDKDISVAMDPTILAIDLDSFSAINNTQSHSAGDWVLKSIADVIKVGIRPTTDVAYRYGGDEFRIILSHTDKIVGGVVAERIRANVEATKCGVTLSIGVGDSDTTADAAQIKAKQQGKNQVVIG
jgi:diguanylate cyclase (GGDEF)-like protein